MVKDHGRDIVAEITPIASLHHCIIASLYCIVGETCETVSGALAEFGAFAGQWRWASSSLSVSLAPAVRSLAPDFFARPLLLGSF